MDVWGQVLQFVGQVPPAVWSGAMVINLMLTAATWSVARRRVRRAGERLANPARRNLAAAHTSLSEPDRAHSQRCGALAICTVLGVPEADEIAARVGGS